MLRFALPNDPLTGCVGAALAGAVVGDGPGAGEGAAGGGVGAAAPNRSQPVSMRFNSSKDAPQRASFIAPPPDAV